MDPQNTLGQLTAQAQTAVSDIEISKKITDKLKQEIEQLKEDATSYKNDANKSKDEISTLLEKVNQAVIRVENSLLTAEENARKSTTKFEEIKNTLENSITASLGGAFTKKEKDARKRDVLWMVILVINIGFIYSIADSKYEKLSKLIESNTPIELILIQIFLGLGTLAGPVWLSWLSTKRLSKIYAISEDYSYKAALAQAYQGYRDAYKDKDELMEQRLLASVVTHLDASPVRLIDSNHPATPLQDLLQQPWMQELTKNPETKINLINWFKEKFPKLIPFK